MKETLFLSTQRDRSEFPPQNSLSDVTMMGPLTMDLTGWILHVINQLLYQSNIKSIYRLITADYESTLTNYPIPQKKNQTN